MEITSEVDGITVKGKTLQYTKVCLAVEIIHPYQDLRDAKHVPSYATNGESFFAQEMMSSALGMLQRLYKVSHFLEENRGALAAEYLKVISHPDFPPDDGWGQFHTKFFALKKQLRSGTITDQDYERELELAQRLNHDLKAEISELLGGFFVRHFPMVMSDSLREQVISILEKESQKSSPTKN